MRARLGSACHSHHPTRRDEADIARASSDSAMPTGDSSMQEKIPNAKSENAVRSQNFSLSFSLSAKAERKAETPPPLGRDRFSLWRPRPARLSAYSWAVSAYRWPKHQNTMAMKSAISISSKWKCGPKNYFGQNRVAQRLFAGGGGGLGLPRRVSGLDARTPAGSVWVETGFSPRRSCASAASMHAGFLQKLRGRRGAPR